MLFTLTLKYFVVFSRLLVMEITTAEFSFWKYVWLLKDVLMDNIKYI